MQWKHSTGSGQASCSRTTSLLLSHLTKIASKELYISRNCACRASSCISFAVAGAFPKPLHVWSQECTELCLCCSSLCCTDSRVDMSILKAFLCKLPSWSVLITLRCVKAVLWGCFTAEQAFPARAGCSSGQVGRGALIEIIHIMAIFH